MEEKSKLPLINLKPLPNFLIRIRTQKSHDNLMRIYEAGRWNWKGGHLPTEYMINAGHGTLIEVMDSFSHFDYSEIENNKKIIEFSDFYKLQGIDKDKKREIYKWFRDNKPGRLSLGGRLM